MLTQEAIQAVLGIREKVYLEPREMADKMNITFFPHRHEDTSEEIIKFAEKLETTFRELHVNIVPYSDALIRVSFFKSLKTTIKVLLSNVVYFLRKIFGRPQKNHYFSLRAVAFLFKRTKIKKGISVVVLGEQDADKLPMQYIYSFKDNSVITILDFPKNITEDSSFHEHFDTALSMFAHNMTNIVIGVDEKKWLLYNFNASHPIFYLDKNFKEDVLHALVPKIVAPIRPYTLSEFIISKEKFSVVDDSYKEQVEDLVKGALLFNETNLYPAGKKIDELPFRNDFYKWIGKLHLDNRNGMSYGFLAVQLPGNVYPLTKHKDFEEKIGEETKSDFEFYHNNLYVKVSLNDGDFWVRVPDVWVLSQKSGSDKTHVNPKRDLIKLGLSNGKMYLETQYDSVIDNDYKTSFDTQVILSHAVGNAIIASVLNHTNPDSEFLKRYLSRGMSISHWHGYIHPEKVPQGWFVHGVANPHVACSSPQSAIYALDGKLKSFSESLEKSIDYKGDIHIEPHHGTNICFTSVFELAEFLVNNKEASVLGNSYYYLYNK